MIIDDYLYGTQHYHKKFSELCEPLVKYLGITLASYKHIDKENKIEAICSNYQWAEKCAEENFFLHDPGIVHPNNMSSGFTFVTTSNDQEYKNSLLKTAQEYGFHNGFCYVEKTDSSYTLFYFASHKDNHKIVNTMVNEAGLLKKFIRNLHKEVISNFKTLQDYRMDPFKLKGDLFLQQKGIVFNEKQENQHRIEILKREGLIPNHHGDLELIDLTKQEINCLRIYMQDSNIKNIAKSLNIAVTTATSYIENIKRKFNCSTKQELLVIASILTSLGKI